MEFNSDELNRFILNLFNYNSLDNDDNDSCDSETAECSSSDQQPTTIDANQKDTTTTSNNNSNKRFCFIVFNDPILSDIVNTQIFTGQQNVTILISSTNTYSMSLCFLEPTTTTTRTTA